MSRVQSRLGEMQGGIDIIHMKYGLSHVHGGAKDTVLKAFVLSPFVSFFSENVTSLHQAKKLLCRVEFHGRLMVFE